MQWTPQQGAFLGRCANTNDSIVLEAVAGSGKTTTLMGAIDVMSGQTAVIAFNKAIAVELEKRLKAKGVDWRTAQAGTVHSFGFRAYKKAIGRSIEVDANKVMGILDVMFEEDPTLQKDIKYLAKKLVGFAKNAGVGISCDMMDAPTWHSLIDHYDVNDSDEIRDEDIIEVAQTALRRSNRMRLVVDFDDMVYLPLLLKHRFFQFDNVMVDEAQDLSWTRQEIAERMRKKTGRVIAVGDRNQAIYGFTGADSDSLDLMKSRFGAKEMPLSVCFRCSTKIIDVARTINPKITAAATSGEGIVDSLPIEEFLKIRDLDASSVMLCRNTKPLVSTAFQMIRNGIPVFVEGRDIGEGLKKLARRWKIRNIAALVPKLEDYKAREMKKAKERNKTSRMQMIEDQVDTLMIIVNRCQSQNKYLIDDVVQEITNIFRDSTDRNEFFTLSTIHRSKGREWDRVFLLDRQGTLPSKYAIQDWQKVQEKNLEYVAVTRAMRQLTFVEVQ